MAPPIGVFDSGVGGLTVLRALRALLPHESYIYLGDTARLPYGTKSAASVVRYSIQAADALVERDIKCLVIACNTASAVALHALRERYAPLPVIGVLGPGAQAACAASITGRIAVIATEGTVRGGAYQAAIHAIRPDARVVAQACALFVALAEEGWIEGPLVEGIVRRYLEPIFAADVASHPDCLLLGCTHFPVLQPVMRRVLDPAVAIVDSAETTARTVRQLLERDGLASPASDPATLQLLATDAPARFARVGGTFFGSRIEESAVEPVDL
ncbi:MAG TPA: glutamate racemase [Steroidobacteraceae bacterium]|nr:glutamate racemase [Steroidobacteraceae bacterium]